MFKEAQINYAVEETLVTVTVIKYGIMNKHDRNVVSPVNGQEKPTDQAVTAIKSN
ncbi:MAG: hypothetical protein HUJ51_06770 [Eggerthellaceae bacterium]|nr:hypothetical protein [Eggerthellaceae bacterium]